MAIKGATFDLQTVLAKYDGAMYNALSNNHNGYVSWTGSGNPITFTDTNVLTLKNGYILVHGRLIVVDGATDITLNPGSSISSGDGRLVLQIDTSKTNTQTVLNQVEILQEYKATSASWRALSTDDINALSTGVYEVQLCHFTVANGTSSRVQIDISTDTLIGNLQDDIDTLADNLETTGEAVGDLQTGKANAGIGIFSGDLNDLTTAGWYQVNSGQTNSPANVTGIVKVIRSLGNTGGIIAQEWTSVANGQMFHRQYTSSTGWTTWTKEVSSVVPIADGGTGLTSNPSMLTNLASSTAAGVLQATPRPGVTGILPVGNGGTGASTADSARANLEAMQQVEYAPGVAFSFDAVKQMYADTPNRDCIIKASFTSGRRYAIKMYSSANYGVIVVFAFGSPSFTIYRLVNQVWYEEYQGRDIVKVKYKSATLGALSAAFLTVDSSETLNGQTFGTLTANRNYITLTAGRYRINTHFAATITANGFTKTCIKTTNNTMMLATDLLYAGCGVGSNGGSVFGVNASDVIELTANTNIYFDAMTYDAVEGFQAWVTIERLG